VVMDSVLTANVSLVNEPPKAVCLENALSVQTCNSNNKTTNDVDNLISALCVRYKLDYYYCCE